MKPVTEYEAVDGRRFRTMEQCFRHEQECAEIRDAMSLIREPKVSGPTYFQHDIESLTAVKSRIWRLVLAKYGESYPHWKEIKAADIHPRSIVGRVLGDNNGPLSSAWSRFMCIDFAMGREYEQPYYAMNPDQATQAMEKSC